MQISATQSFVLVPFQSVTDSKTDLVGICGVKFKEMRARLLVSFFLGPSEVIQSFALDP